MRYAHMINLLAFVGFIRLGLWMLASFFRREDFKVCHDCQFTSMLSCSTRQLRWELLF